MIFFLKSDKIFRNQKTILPVHDILSQIMKKIMKSSNKFAFSRYFFPNHQRYAQMTKFFCLFTQFFFQVTK